MNKPTDIAPEKMVARVAAGAMLTASAGRAAESLDRFGLWFLTSFGAGLALLISQADEVAAFIPRQTVASAAYLFLWAAVACMGQRYVATIVVGGAEAGKEGMAMGEKFQTMDADEFLSEMLRGTPRPARWMCVRMFANVARGDFACGGRLFMRLTMVQGLLITAEMVLLLIALKKVVDAIPA